MDTIIEELIKRTNQTYTLYIQKKMNHLIKDREVKIMYEQEIANFSEKWINKFSQKTYRTIPRDTEFEEECLNLGFQYDHGESLDHIAPSLHAFSDLNDLKMVIGELNDPVLLGSSLHSKWKTCNSSNSCFNREDRQWFLMMLNRLNDVADYKKRHPKH